MFIGKTKNFIGKFKMETPKTIWIDEFVCLRSKVYSFKCKKKTKIKTKTRDVSKSLSKHIKFEEYKNCLDGKDYQKESNNYILRSINHEMYLEEVKKINTIYFR